MTDKNDNGIGRRPPPAATLADVIYTDPTDELVPERDWVVLVNLIAAGDQRALRELYERSHRLVFSLIARITKSRDTADDLTVEVFHDLWKRAPEFASSEGSVLAWIMGLARAKALGRVLLDQELNAAILIPKTPLWGAIAKRIAAESAHRPAFTAPVYWVEPDWKPVAPASPASC